jgi:hypothetical protein
MNPEISKVLIESLGLQSWAHSEFFLPTEISEIHPVVEKIEQYIASAALDQHPFFAEAKVNTNALLLWASQEIVMTNAFSQIVLFAASRVRNVHVRAVLAEVAYGEHGRCKHGLAAKSHPWLLEQLRTSVELSWEKVTPHPATISFIGRLCEFLENPLSSIAGIGVGNERLIEPEYKAIKHCFAAKFPGANFAPFLDANLSEDLTHSRLCYEAATALIVSDDDATKFLGSACRSVDSRVQYFDQLLRSTRN